MNVLGKLSNIKSENRDLKSLELVKVKSPSKLSKTVDEQNFYNEVENLYFDKYQFNLKESHLSNKGKMDKSFQSSKSKERNCDKFGMFKIRKSSNLNINILPKEEGSICSANSNFSQNSSKKRGILKVNEESYIKGYKRIYSKCSELKKGSSDLLKKKISKEKKKTISKDTNSKIKNQRKLNKKHLIRVLKPRINNEYNFHNQVSTISDVFRLPISEAKSVNSREKVSETHISSKSHNKKLSLTRLKSQLILEEKFKKLNYDHEKLKRDYVLNKNILNVLAKKLAKAEKKEKLYDRLFTSNKEAQQALIKFEYNYLQCDLIRKEQAKLIKSLQKELMIYKTVGKEI